MHLTSMPVSTVLIQKGLSSCQKLTKPNNLVYSYGRRLEEEKFSKVTADFAFYLSFIATVIVVSIH